jgi:predicted O-methyltransferase YrrM
MRRSEDIWPVVDTYLCDRFVRPDAALEATLASSEAAGLPPINVAPNQGKLLGLLARMRGARRILEVGTLGGYSTIWLARALPKDGHLVTLEANATHAAVARANMERAGLESLVEVRLGPASETLAQLVHEKVEPFDFVFIDADKAGYPDYFAWSMKLTHPGSVIVADNVVRDGAVADSTTTDPLVAGVRAFNDLVAAEPRADATAIQTVGSKGYDGFALILVTA